MFRPTYEMAILCQRAGDGDLTVLPDLWPLLFEEPFEPTRPLDDIAKDIADKFEAYNKAVAAEAAEKAKTADPYAETRDVINRMLDLAADVLTPQSKRK